MKSQPSTHIVTQVTVYDEDTKLYYLMARYYNPDTGVFLSLDPVRGDIMNPITMNGYNYGDSNPVMNVDPDGEFSIRTSVLLGAINALIVSIPGLYAINNLIKQGKKVQVHKLLNGKKIVLGVELKKYFSRWGLKVALATTVASVIVNTLLGAFNSSVGTIVVWGLKKYFFKSYTIKAKKYIYWGPKVNVEYINFSKRK